MLYFATIAHDSDGWSVTFPDCPGCQTCGDTEEEAVEMAHDALDGWLATHLQDGDSPPRPVATTGHAIHVGPRIAIAMQLRWAREDRGESQGRLASLVGVSQQQIAKLESPDGNPSLATLEKVARVLGVRVDVSLVAA
ncbi:MAG: type II toxin-antitoxin system HicB family antitoxin [Polyangiaceae bacterium]|nr:type II toxin-antitoxin system HicB family antitoxin [Polyangiaceae bacterium]